MRTRGSVRFSHDKKGALQNVSDDNKVVRLSRPIGKPADGKRIAETRQPSGRTTGRVEAHMRTSGRVEASSNVRNKPVDRKKKGSSQAEIQRFTAIRSPARASSPTFSGVSYPESIQKCPRQVFTPTVQATPATHGHEVSASTQSRSSPSMSQTRQDGSDLTTPGTLANGNLTNWLSSAFAMFENAVGFNLCNPTGQPAPATSTPTPASPTVDPGQEQHFHLARSTSLPYMNPSTTTADDINANTTRTARSFKSTSMLNELTSEEEPEIQKSPSLDIGRASLKFGQNLHNNPSITIHKFNPSQVQSSGAGNGAEEQESPKPTKVETGEVGLSARETRRAASREYRSVSSKKHRSIETDLPISAIRRVTSEDYGRSKRKPETVELDIARNIDRGELKPSTHEIRRTVSREYRSFAKRSEGNDTDILGEALRRVSSKDERKSNKRSQDSGIDLSATDLNLGRVTNRDQRPKKSAQEIRQVTSLVMDLTRETAKREATTHPTRVVRVSTKTDTGKKRQNSLRNYPKTGPIGYYSTNKRGYV